MNTLACVGVNGFDRARLRLLLGEAGGMLHAQWRIGSPEQADMMIVKPGSLEADAAAVRARGRGVRCVNLGAPGEIGDDFLAAGFEVSDLADVLNAASPGGCGKFRSIDAGSPGFFDAVAREGVSDIPDSVPEAVDLERYLRRDSGEHTVDKLIPQRLDETTSIEPIDNPRPSQRAQARNSSRDPFARQEREAEQGLIDPRARRRSLPGNQPAAPGAGRPLADYLGGGLLMAPSMVTVEGAEPLILDPKNSLYLINGDLESAEPYIANKFAFVDFERLTTRELEHWRSLCEARPYLELRWLIALRGGDGWLPRHLDPGGSYRLRDSLQLGEHFAAQMHIAQAMKTWRRLHEVAADAGVDMQNVFNAVAAFDAIGWLEWRPRERSR